MKLEFEKKLIHVEKWKKKKKKVKLKPPDPDEEISSLKIIVCSDCYWLLQDRDEYR